MACWKVASPSLLPCVWLLLIILAVASREGEPLFLGINAVTFVTSDMVASFGFYKALGLNCTFGGPNADFTTFGSPGGPGERDNWFHINLFTSLDYKRP
mmetsp:Transcript_56580/g.147405  ORF Transcript_56580/g.147405 Transcript_56580/m.147405 type:complete len:99 (-) Transcript_56580:140-436(-)